MKSFGLTHRAIGLLGLWLLLSWVSLAGTPNQVFVPEDNELNTTNDDVARAVNLHWYDGADVMFYYYTDQRTGTLLQPTVNTGIYFSDPGDIVEGMQRAIKTWNKTKLSSFRFNEDLVPASTAINHPLSNSFYPGIPDYMADGFNLITFDPITPYQDAASPMTTIVTFFMRDFNMKTMYTGNGIPPSFLGGSTSNLTGVTLVEVDLNEDNKFDMVLPIRNYKQGEIIDTDIVFNPALTLDFRAWPEKRSDVLPEFTDQDVIGSYDIQMLLTHALGWAQGVANSAIFDSVMYPNFYNSFDVYPTDPYKKRKLSFDDEMTAGIVHGLSPEKFNPYGAIGGVVLDGAIVGAAVSNDGTTGTTTSETGTTADVLDQFIIQAPVFAAVRPEMIPQIQALNQNFDDSPDHPDNVVAAPLTPDAYSGTYRLVAQVLTGQDLAIPAGPGSAVYLNYPAPTTGPGSGSDQTATTTEPGTVTNGQSRLNSTYLIPGLPATTDDKITPVDYAVYLAAEIGGATTGGTTTGGTAASAFNFNDVHSVLTTMFPKTYPSEFYGGPTIPVQFGNGNATVLMNSSDDLFENNYITGQVDANGRFAAAINGGPSLLSGFNSQPRSYVVVGTDKGMYSNNLGSLGTITQPVRIQDAAGEASGGWMQPNNFSFLMQYKISDGGGAVGIPAGIEVIQTITNEAQTSQTFTVRQVLDAALFGRENPVYMVHDKVTTRSETLTGLQIPKELIYQTSVNDPVFRAFVTLGGPNITTPDKLTIGLLSELGQTIPPGQGSNLRGFDALSLDSGVALTWNVSLGTGQKRVLRYIIGFLPPGMLNDTWVPMPGTDTGTGSNANEQLTGMEDDPGKITPVHVTPGQVTDNIDIITNTGTSGTEGQTIPNVPEGSSAGALQFVRVSAGFPITNLQTTGGAIGDIDNDGDLDIVTSCMSGGEGANNGATNRIYTNVQRISTDGTTSPYFKDVTFGEDGIPGDASSDDRIYPLHPSEDTISVVMGDFDGDGYQDLVFFNRNARNRYYENQGSLGHPGFFREPAEDENYPIPGLLNGGTPGNATIDSPFRATVGDIDSDGDLDIIISQLYPFTDPYGTSGWVDLDPRDIPNGFPYGDRRFNSQTDLFTLPFRYAERVLINMTNIPPYAEAWNLLKRGPMFLDQTLGTDDRSGTLTHLEISRSNDDFEYQFLDSWDPSELDRMPPVFPPMFRTTAQADGWKTSGQVASAMGAMGVEPHLGPIFSSAALDLLSIRGWGGYREFYGATIPLTSLPEGYQGGDGKPTFFTVAVGNRGFAYEDSSYGREQAIFRNMDLFSNGTRKLGPDGIADGYFGCMNYNQDWGTQIGQDFIDSGVVYTGPGLFAIEEDDSANAEKTKFRYDAFPLFIGMPEGHPADYTPTTGFESDIISPVPRVSWTGGIGDWQNKGAPRPFIAPDNDPNGGPFCIFDYVTEGSGEGLCGKGIWRGQTSNQRYGNSVAHPYFDPSSYAYRGVTWNAAVIEMPSRDIAIDKVGEPFSMVSGDFDRDGDQDIFIVNSSTTGMTDQGGPTGSLRFLFGPPAPKQLLINDSFGNFTDAPNALTPNEKTNAIYALSGDIDNDGAIDLVVLNMLSPNELYLNQIYKKAPDLLDQKDATLFYDSTFNSIPQVSSAALLGPFGDNTARTTFGGVTVGATVTDLNGDNRPDLVLAEGGKLTRDGDYTRVLLNMGEQRTGEAVPVFKPGGSSYPGPRTDLWTHNFDPLPSGYRYSERFNAQFYNGYLGDLGFTTDVAAGDVDNDGDNDLIMAHASMGPQLVINQDSDDKMLNNIPDGNMKGDAIYDFSDGMPPLFDPGVPNPGDTTVLKRQNRKIKMADFNNDGLIDVVIANGIEGSGAPNVLLFNSPDIPGRFIDVTETNLPTVKGTDGLVHGTYDNTVDIAVGDFNQDGFVDIVFLNDSNPACPLGCRLLLNDPDNPGHFTETSAGSHIPEFQDRMPRSIVAADFDRLGEATEDKNHNGILDPGEDTNGNGRLDWTDESSGDGVVRHDGIWDGSLDLFVTFDDGSNAILINDPANPGILNDETLQRFPGSLNTTPSRGCDVGDINLDGDLDIVVAKYVGGVTNLVQVWINGTKTIGGKFGHGYFTDVSYEVPYSRALATYAEVSQDITGSHEDTNTGWANDVSLLDIDGDGDLDLFVSCLANANLGTVFGAYDLLFMNRLIGDSWNLKPHDLSAQAGSPVVYSASPPASAPGKQLTVTLTGENFQGGTLPGSVTRVSFGSGVTVTNVARQDPNHLVVSITVANDAQVGPRSITAVNPDAGRSTVTKPGVFQIYKNLESQYRNEVPNPIWTLYN